MILSLEVLQANEGDCLILHYGTPEHPQIIVIDGGPSGIYKNHLKPRLLQIKDSLTVDDPLPISMVMVSHADDDHINGIVMLTNDLVQQQTDHKDLSFKIDKFWFNSFDDIIGNIEIPVISTISPNVTAASNELSNNSILNKADNHLAAVIASTGQGRNIRDNAETLALAINSPFTALANGSKLIRADLGNSKISLNENFSINVVHPNQQRLIELQKKWDDDLKKAREQGDNSIILASLVSTDKSPFNLSSIVCLLEQNGKKILITGDGRSDDIFNGLKENNLLDSNDKLHVDILKMPHHGSKANMTEEFLQKITADHYVISADGKHDNPDQEVLDMFEKNVKSGTLHLTNHTGKLGLQKKIDNFIKKLQDENSNLIISFPSSGMNSSVINLEDALNY
jgi:hypothetical protein